MMENILPELPMLITFITASFVLAVIPGPVVLYVVTRTMMQGRASGLASVAGVTLGNLGNALGACFGLAALFAVSSLAFTAIKLLGAVYLIYLGIKTIYGVLKKPTTLGEVSTPKIKKTSLRRIFTDGFFVALLNPKTALFFAAFLPQFLDASAASPLMQSITLSLIFCMIASVTDGIYALLAGSVMPLVKRTIKAPKIGAYISGSVFIALGILTAFAPQKSSR